jgi:negative regulator of sigma E activity
MEKISRLMDGDIPQNELAATLRASGVEGRDSWQTYHLIGEALRGDLEKSGGCVVKDSALFSRICGAIADEPNVFVPAVASANKAARERGLSPVSSDIEIPAAQNSLGNWQNVVNGAAIWKPWALAASVATAAVVGWQTLVTQPRELAAAKAQASATAQSSSPMTSVAVPSASMSRYLNAHTEAAPVTRLSGPRVYIQNVSATTH